MDDDFDLEKFVELFDTAMTSDNPTVRKAFKNLMLVAALVESGDSVKTGPFKTLFNDLQRLKQRVSVIETSGNSYKGGGLGVGVGIGTSNPVPYYGSNSGHWYTPNTTLGTTTWTIPPYDASAPDTYIQDIYNKLNGTDE